MEALRPDEAATQRALADAGLHVKPGWICQALRAAPSGRAAGPSQQEIVYQLALYSDLREAGAGCLPPGIEGFENSTVEGKFVLQVDEIVDVSQASEHRHGIVNNRTLKMLLTDGVQSIVGMEKKKLLDLNVNSCAGLKIAVQNFQVRRGIAMLRPENCCVLGGMEADLEKRRLKRIADEERSRTRRQIVADAEPEDEDRVHGDSQMPSQHAQAPAHARPGNAAPGRPSGRADRQHNAAPASGRFGGGSDDNDNVNSGARMPGRIGSDDLGNFGASARDQQQAGEDRGASAGASVQRGAGWGGRGTEMPSIRAQAGIARRQPLSSGGANEAAASDTLSQGVLARDRQAPLRASAGSGGFGVGGARGGSAVQMEEDYDALLAAQEHDDVEDDPAYQLMLEEDFSGPPPVRVPLPLAPRPPPPPAAPCAPQQQQKPPADVGRTGAREGNPQAGAYVQISRAGVAAGEGDCRTDGDVQMSGTGLEDKAGVNGLEKHLSRNGSAPSPLVSHARRQSEESAAVRSLSVAAGPVKRSRDGSSTLFATQTPLHVKSMDGAHAQTADTGEREAGAVGEGGLGVGEVGWQSLGEVRDMVSTGSLAAGGDGGRVLVRVKGVCSGALKFHKSDFAVATVLTDGTGKEEHVLLTCPVLESLLHVTSGQVTLGHAWATPRVLCMSMSRQYSNMPKPERNQTTKNISEALSRTEGIFVIEVSAAANGRRASGGGEHGSPGGAADVSPGTAETQQLWRVVAIQQPTLADARWMLARAQRCQSDRAATP